MVLFDYYRTGSNICRHPLLESTCGNIVRQQNTICARIHTRRYPDRRMDDVYRFDYSIDHIHDDGRFDKRV